MTDAESLYAVILAHPDEDTPRLMYADSLDERDAGGDSFRAAFIRAQVAGLDAEADVIYRQAYTSSLYATAFPELDPSRWLFPTLDKVRPLYLSVGRTSLVQGFVGTLGMTAQEWIHVHERVSAQFPVTSLAVTRWKGYEHQLSAAVTPGLRSLRLTGSAAEFRDSNSHSLLSHARHKGWADTLRELEVHRLTANARERLLASLPKVRIRNEHGAWLPADSAGCREFIGNTTIPVGVT